MSNETILIVDDEENVAMSHRLRLEDEYDVLVAYSGEECLEMISDEVDILLLDRHMPEISGDEVLRRLQDKPYIDDMFVIMATAVEPDVEAIKLEFDDYLEKPVTGKEIKESIERLQAFGEYKSVLRECYSITKKISMMSEIETDEREELERELAEKQNRLLELMRDFPDDVQGISTEVHSLPEKEIENG